MENAFTLELDPTAKVKIYRDRRVITVDIVTKDGRSVDFLIVFGYQTVVNNIEITWCDERGEFLDRCVYDEVPINDDEWWRAMPQGVLKIVNIIRVMWTFQKDTSILVESLEDILSILNDAL